MRSIAATAAAAVCTAGAFAQFDFQSQTILIDGMWNNPTSIAVDSAGSAHAAYMTQQGTDSSTKEIWYATDASGSWAFTRITDNAVREEFPSLTLDAQDNVHIAFHTGVATTNQIRYTNNIGGDFGPIINITDPGFIIVNVSTDAQGLVHFAFYSQVDGPDDIYYRTYLPGTGLGPLINLTQTAGVDESDPDIAVEADGTSHVVFQGSNVLGGTLAYMNNRSGAFEQIQTNVAGVVSHPLVAVDSMGKVSIAYRQSDTLYLVEETSPGEFGASLALTTPGLYRPAFMDRIAVGPDNRRYLAFASNVTTNGPFFIGETDSGFSEPIRMPQTGSSYVGASVAINSDGHIAMTYQISGFDGQVFADMFIAAAQAGQNCPADFNGDGQVNTLDFLAFLNAFNASDPAADFNGDGSVNTLDFLAFLNAFNTGCP